MVVNAVSDADRCMWPNSLLMAFLGGGKRSHRKAAGGRKTKLLPGRCISAVSKNRHCRQGPWLNGESDPQVEFVVVLPPRQTS